MPLTEREVELFETARHRLGALAYRLLGSAVEAEDAVQDAFLHWEAADRSGIRSPAAWLTKAVTNVCLDRLSSGRMRRERAFGQRLPEPVLDGDPLIGPAEIAERRESVSLAVLVLLERLKPLERAVCVLRETFSHSHREIARILDISEASSQQHLHRARERLGDVRHEDRVDAAGARAVVEAFLDAAASGRTERLVALLREDATAVGDGGDAIPTAPREYRGADRVASYLRAACRPTPAKRRLLGGAPTVHAAVVNASPALVAVVDGHVVGVMALSLVDGRITAVRTFADPARLARLDRRWRAEAREGPLLESW